MLSVSIILLLFVFSAGASFVQRVTGFGFGIFIMTVLPHLMPSYGEATALSGLLAMMAVMVTVVQHYRFLCFRKLFVILATFVVVSFFAVKTVAAVNDHLLRQILGVMLIAVSIYFFFVSDRIRMRPSVSVQIGMGSLSGIMGGFFAMQGPPAVIYFLSCTDTKEEYIAISSFYFIVSNLIMTGFRAANGFVTPTVLQGYLIGLPGVALGLWLGNIVFRKMPIETIRKAVYVYMALSGVIVLLA